jgi:hypothetical protein
MESVCSSEASVNFAVPQGTISQTIALLVASAKRTSYKNHDTLFDIVFCTRILYFVRRSENGSKSKII